MTRLLQLFNNEIDCIIVDNFLSPTQIAALLGALNQQPEWLESHQDIIEKRLYKDIPRSPQLFASQYVAYTRDKSEANYIEECRRYQSIWNDLVTTCGYDPFSIFESWLSEEAQDAKLIKQPYFPLSLRDLGGSVFPHADFGPFDGPNWAVAKVQKQVAWNLYLTDPITGGDTTLYDHLWQATDPIDVNSYGNTTTQYPIKQTFSVKPGRLVLFNSRNFHSVSQSQQPRIAMGGLLGLVGDDIMLWS